MESNAPLQWTFDKWTEPMSAQHPSSPHTLSVHGGIRESEFRPLTPPIYQTSSFAFEDADEGAALFLGKARGSSYSRRGNPTVEGLERAIAGLEGGHKGLACATGIG